MLSGERERERETDRQTDRQTERQRDRETERDRDVAETHVILCRGALLWALDTTSGIRCV